MTSSRRNFIYKTMAAAGAVSLFPQLTFAASTKILGDVKIAQEIVDEFVLVAHSDFERMKVLLEKHPHLLNATVDWGDGDFESAIGAAGHMGHVDYANYLLDRGARFDIFVLTMLGKTDIVMPMIEAFPQMLNAIGPHGFTLLHHAEKGKEAGKELYDYFVSKGLTEKFIKTFDRE